MTLTIDQTDQNWVCYYRYLSFVLLLCYSHISLVLLIAI